MLNDAAGQEEDSRNRGHKGARSAANREGTDEPRGNEPREEQEMWYRVFRTLAEPSSSPTQLQWGRWGELALLPVVVAQPGLPVANIFCYTLPTY